MSLLASYLALLKLRGASPAALPAAFARLAVTMLPVALLLTVVQSGFSLAVGGGVSAAYAIGSAAGAPVAGRLMDRHGPASVLRVLGPVSALMLGLVAALSNRLPALAVAALAFGAGVSNPPVGASMRSLWLRLTSVEALRQRSYSFEATLSESLFIIGPATITVLAGLFGARHALLVTAVLLGGGALGFACADVVRQWEGRRAAVEAGGPRRSLAMFSALVAIALTAALSSALVVAVTALLRAQGSATALAGALVALQSVGSVLGGLYYGTRHREGSAYARYLRLLLVLALALASLPSAYLAHRAGLPALQTLVLLGVLLALSGLPIAPVAAEEFQLIAELAAHEKMTQAFAGVGSFIALGGAAGAGIAGVVADGLGPAAALSIPAVCCLAAWLLMQSTRNLFKTAAAMRPESTTNQEASA